MKRLPTRLEGLMLFELEMPGDGVVEPDYFPDRRGSFCITWNFDRLTQLGMPQFGSITQVSTVYSQPGVIRGMHAEPWDKLINVPFGEVWAVALDLRLGSATFGQYESFWLTDKKVLYLPSGFGNGYQAVRHCLYHYCVNGVWSAEASYTMINYKDPDLAIPWPLHNVQIVSDKDQNHPVMREVFPNWRA